jgi:hypothetical protein
MEMGLKDDLGDAVLVPTTSRTGDLRHLSDLQVDVGKAVLRKIVLRLVFGIEREEIGIHVGLRRGFPAEEDVDGDILSLPSHVGIPKVIGADEIGAFLG